MLTVLFVIVITLIWILKALGVFEMVSKVHT